MSWRPGIAVLSAALACTGLVACADDEPEQATVQIGVATAPSLESAFDDMIAAFEADHPDVRVSLETGRSDSIADGLGGRSDINVFASASEPAMEQVVQEGVAVDPQLFARNHVVLAVPTGNPSGIASLEDLAQPALRVGLCAVDVPCGKAADTLLAAAGVFPADPERNDGSRALAARLAGNELDVGIVYRTDVASSHGWVSRAVVDPRDQELEQAAGTTRYVVARVPGGEGGPDAEAERAATEDFLELVLSDQGRRALEAAGLGTLPG